MEFRFANWSKHLFLVRVRTYFPLPRVLTSSGTWDPRQTSPGSPDIRPSCISRHLGFDRPCIKAVGALLRCSFKKLPSIIESLLTNLHHFGLVAWAMFGMTDGPLRHDLGMNTQASPGPYSRSHRVKDTDIWTLECNWRFSSAYHHAALVSRHHAKRHRMMHEPLLLGALWKGAFY